MISPGQAPMVIFFAVGNNSSPGRIQPAGMGRELCDQAARVSRLQIIGVLIVLESLSVPFLGTFSTGYSESNSSLLVVFPMGHGFKVESLP